REGPHGVGAGARLQRERRRHRTGVRALGLPIDVLRAHLEIGALARGLGGGLDGNGRGKEPHVAVVPAVVTGPEGLEVGPGLVRAQVHLPVGGEEQPPHASSRAATPGRGLPSRSSSAAPPPVDTWGSLSSSPAPAAAESPPPTTVVAPRFPASTIASPMARVPASKGGVSNTPMGPFQNTVLAWTMRERKSSRVA